MASPVAVLYPPDHALPVIVALFAVPLSIQLLADVTDPFTATLGPTVTLSLAKMSAGIVVDPLIESPLFKLIDVYEKIVYVVLPGKSSGGRSATRTWRARLKIAVCPAVPVASRTYPCFADIRSHHD